MKCGKQELEQHFTYPRRNKPWNKPNLRLKLSKVSAKLTYIWRTVLHLCNYDRKAVAFRKCMVPSLKNDANLHSNKDLFTVELLTQTFMEDTFKILGYSTPVNAREKKRSLAPYWEFEAEFFQHWISVRNLDQFLNCRTESTPSKFANKFGNLMLVIFVETKNAHFLF